MSDQQLGFLHGLLQETRDGQIKGNAILADLRVEVAALQRSQEGQASHIADMRAEVRQVGDRLRTAEMEMQRLPATEAALNKLESRQLDIEGRVRVLEGDGRETKIITRAVTGSARDVWRYLIGAVIGLAVAAISYAMKFGTP